MSNCYAYHLADDPNLFDRSWFLMCGTQGVVSGNRIDWGGANNHASFPFGCAAGTGIEIHGAATVLAHNVIIGAATGINVGAESFDMVDCMIVDNIIQQATAGINLVCAQGFMAQRVEIARNLITIITIIEDGRGKLPGEEETGINLGSGGLAFGVGVFDLRVHDNSIIFTGTSSRELSAGIRLGSLLLAPGVQSGGANTGGLTATIAERGGGIHYSPLATPTGNMYSHQGFRYCSFEACTIAGTPPATFPTTTGQAFKDGVNDDPSLSKDTDFNFLCSGPMTSGTSLTTGGGWDVYDNKIRGFQFCGIYLGVANLFAGGNLCGDVHVHDNLLYNTGIYGIDVEGYTQATSPEFVGLEILNNQILDDRAAGTHLQWGVRVNASTDKTTIVWGNRVLGDTDGDVHFGISPPAQHYWPTWPVLQVSEQIGFFGAGPVGQQPGGGPSTAGPTYTSQEQSMLNFCYSALLAYGLIS